MTLLEVFKQKACRHLITYKNNKRLLKSHFYFYTVILNTTMPVP